MELIKKKILLSSDASEYNLKILLSSEVSDFGFFDCENEIEEIDAISYALTFDNNYFLNSENGRFILSNK